MSGFAARVAATCGVDPGALRRLSGGDLSEVLSFRRRDGRDIVAKGGPAVAMGAAMLRALAGAGLPVPLVEGEHSDILLLEHVGNDGIFSPAAWRDIGRQLRGLHDRLGEAFGWAADYRIGTVELDNRPAPSWRDFWARRLESTASVLDRPWRERVAKLTQRLGALPESPPPSLLHGDLWGGNILVLEGRLIALIDPACFYGDREVDLAMLTLFDDPLPDFWQAYGPLAEGWEQRRSLYQLFPALVHLRLFGSGYAGMVDRLLLLNDA